MLLRSLEQVFTWRRVAGSVRRLRGSGGAETTSRTARQRSGRPAPLGLKAEEPARLALVHDAEANRLEELGRTADGQPGRFAASDVGDRGFQLAGRDVE
jgi:hypothetical protein